MPDLACSANAAVAFDFLRGRGLTDIQAAAVIGNLQEESGLDPTRSAVDTNGLPSRGIAMWQPPRWQNLSSFASASGRDPTALDVQLDFLWYELQTDPSKGLAALTAATTLESAVVAFQNGFERPKKALAHTDVRLAYAQSALYACPKIEPPPKPPSRIAATIAAAAGALALATAAGFGIYRALAARRREEELPPPPPEPPYYT